MLIVQSHDISADMHVTGTISMAAAMRLNVTVAAPLRDVVSYSRTAVREAIPVWSFDLLFWYFYPSSHFLSDLSHFLKPSKRARDGHSHDACLFLSALA
ncbi:MAG: hypothetical protein PHH28_01640 [Desulfuromonadaceae bacterium]|nr:hypothetical protein [Desulfuromonadaceae bacterium]